MMDTREAAREIGAYSVDAHGVGARSIGEVRFLSVSTDSRTLEPGALFVALRGERFDGHEFLDAVRERGAAAVMIDEAGAREHDTTGLPAIVVDDTRRALGRLAACWRARFDIPLVAVAGSNGKTTVKEMIAAILGAHYGTDAVLATVGNFNNEIGLPLTLLRLRETHAAAVIEVGMNHPGETRELAAITAPTVALVNNAQREHQEFMASVEDVAHEHGALFAALRPGGTAVINADDDYAEYWRGVVPGECDVRDFSIHHRLAAAVTGRHQLTGFGSDIILDAPEGDASFSLQVPGLHNVRNAVAAAAAATAAGASLVAVARGLSAFNAVKGRLQRRQGRNGSLVIDDTYNANPDSVRAAIEVLATFERPRVLVLGDMGEVGEQGPAFHAEIGRHARECGLSALLLLGDATTHTAAAFGEGARHFESIDDLLAAAAACDVPGATVLVKGSRFMRMERIVAALVNEAANENSQGMH